MAPRPCARAAAPAQAAFDVASGEIYPALLAAELRPHLPAVAELLADVRAAVERPGAERALAAWLAAVTGGEYQTTRVGDLWDTSPYNTDYPVECVSTQVFIRNMGELIETLAV